MTNIHVKSKSELVRKIEGSKTYYTLIMSNLTKYKPSFCTLSDDDFKQGLQFLLWNRECSNVRSNCKRKLITEVEQYKFLKDLDIMYKSRSSMIYKQNIKAFKHLMNKENTSGFERNTNNTEEQEKPDTYFFLCPQCENDLVLTKIPETNNLFICPECKKLFKLQLKEVVY